jgi:hypothetical protein
MSTDFTDLVEVRCPLLEQPTNDMCVGDLVKLLAYNTAVLERTLLDNVVPAGVISYYSGSLSEVPAGLLVCDGAFYEPETYPELFENIHYTHGKSDDPDNFFAVPDLRVSIIQGMALSSDTMATTEQPNWQGNDPSVGGVVNGDYVGASITHANTTNGVASGSRYDKVAMIPVISTGEICNREDVVSTTPRPCSITGLSLHTLSIDDKTLCILNEFGAVNNCIELPIPDVIGVGDVLPSKKEVFTPVFLDHHYDNDPTIDTTLNLNSFGGVTVPNWATHAIVKARTSCFGSDTDDNVIIISRVTVSGIVVSETILRMDTQDYTYGGKPVGVDINDTGMEEVAGFDSSVMSVPLYNGVNIDIILEKESTGTGTRSTAATLYLLGFEGLDSVPLVMESSFRKESFRPILIDFEDSGAVSGIRNFDISTLSGNGISAGAIDIPTWATNVLLKGTMRTTAPYASTMYIDDVPFLEMENFGISSDNVIGHNVLIDSFSMISGSNIEYEFDGNGLSSSSFFKLEAVGFEGYLEGALPSCDETGLLEENGWTELCNGLIMQWGTLKPSSRLTNVLLPKPFPNAFLNASASIGADFTDYPYEDNSIIWGAYPNGLSTIKIMSNIKKSDNSNPTYKKMYWQAYGH